jgi:hypothetical protein
MRGSRLLRLRIRISFFSFSAPTRGAAQRSFPFSVLYIVSKKEHGVKWIFEKHLVFCVKKSGPPRPKAPEAQKKTCIAAGGVV